MNYAVLSILTATGLALYTLAGAGGFTAFGARLALAIVTVTSAVVTLVVATAENRHELHGGFWIVSLSEVIVLALGTWSLASPHHTVPPPGVWASPSPVRCCCSPTVCCC